MANSAQFLVWGNNQSNLLSKSSIKCLSTPISLTLPYDIVSICASQKHVSFITRQGDLYSYGSNLDGRLGVSTRSVDKASFTEPIKVNVGSKVLRVQSGFSHMIILTEKYQLFSWGLGDYGALGTGQFKSRSVPTKVDLSKQLVTKLRQISCGAMHTAFLFQNGQLYACGSNQYGQLGVNRPEKVSKPIPVSFHQKVQQISCGVFYTLMLTRDGKVYGMGNNKYGQLGTGHKVNQCHPTLIRQLNDIVKVTAGYHSGAIDKYGNLYLWGSGSFGELLKPKKFVLSIPIKDIAIRGFFGVAIGHTSKNQNRIYTWGNNTFGELGQGTYQSLKQPEQVQNLRGIEVSRIALGVNFALVLLPSSNTQSKWIEESAEQKKQKSQQKLGKEEEKYSNHEVSQKKSIIGFQQRYLVSNRRQGEQYIPSLSKGRQTKLFDALKSQRSRDYEFYLQSELERSYDRLGYQQRLDRNQRSIDIESKSPFKQATQRYSKNEAFLGKSYKQDHLARSREAYSIDNYLNPINPVNIGNPPPAEKDYQKLFTQLSEDYEILLKKYVQLERQMQLMKSNSQSQNQSQNQNISKKQAQVIIKEVERINEFDKSEGKDRKSENKREAQLLAENLNLKNEIQRLNYQILVLNDEKRSLKRKIEQIGDLKIGEKQKIEKQDLKRQNNSNVTVSQIPAQKNSIGVGAGLSEEIENQYKRLLNQKEQFIAKLTSSFDKAEDQYHSRINKLVDDNQNLKNKINIEIDNNRKIINEHQSLIDELEIQIKKSEQICQILRQENDGYKMELTAAKSRISEIQPVLISTKARLSQIQPLLMSYKTKAVQLELISSNLKSKNGQLQSSISSVKIKNTQLEGAINILKARNVELEGAQQRANEATAKEKVMKQKFETTLRQSLLKEEATAGKLAQLQVQLSYQRQFNRKYQQNLAESKQQNERIHKEMNQQIGINNDKTSKIQNLKSEIQKLKKYKKELDEKNIQMEEYAQNLENIKRRSKQLLEEKEKEMKMQNQFYDKKMKQFESAIGRKDQQIEEYSKQLTKYQKQINRWKQNNNLLKNQLVVKEDQLQHLSQQRSNMQKKLNLLTAQLDKEVQERQHLLKQLGDCKRQLSKFKVINGELESKLVIQTEEKNKVLKANSIQEQQIHRLKDEVNKMNQKCENLRKQNNMYRQQVEEISYQLESQSKINQELTKANRQFAENQQQFHQKINELENKIYELEDQNKSYTPRYQALLIRNKELDDRNRELAQMINKAIEIQAQSYKNNILKEVQINSDNIINQFKEEQEFQFRGRRNKNRSKQTEKEVTQEPGLTHRGQNSEIIKEEPYTKMMKQRISDHKKKVSQSAQKLASLLELNEKRPSKISGQDRNQTQDYEKINYQMQSFNNQKDQFMSKIHSFAEKLKII